MIVFPCPICGKELKVKGDLAGKRGKCPFCKSKVAVPPSGVSSASTPAPTPKHAAPAAKPVPKVALDTDPGLAASPGTLTEFLEPPRVPDELGRLGKYRVLRILGAGGMGVVFAG